MIVIYKTESVSLNDIDYILLYHTGCTLSIKLKKNPVKVIDFYGLIKHGKITRTYVRVEVTFNFYAF